MEQVVLVDQHNAVLGTMPKAQVHTLETPLHRGFSVFIFNQVGELLLQQRSFGKVTWPGFWSNSCCGHPALGESVADAIQRRVSVELGMQVHDLFEALPDFQYCCEYGGVVENEICPVWLARTLDAACSQPARSCRDPLDSLERFQASAGSRCCRALFAVVQAGNVVAG